jgi:ABC-type glycerol-3-phosphate transport system permease component
MNSFRGPRLRRASWFVLLLASTLVVNVPTITMILNSLKSTPEILSTSGFFPLQPTLANYAYLLIRTDYLGYFRNSLIVAGAGTILSVVAAALAGYALSRYRIAFTAIYARLLLVVQLFPIILALIPLFILFRGVGLVNSFAGVVLLYTVGQLPFATWMFRGFFDAIPPELEAAAWTDGCTRLQAFRYIVLPLSGPPTVAVTIFAFLFSYNEFLIANVFLRDPAMLTLPVGLRLFQQQYATDWGSVLAAATLAMVPTFLLFLVVQRYLEYGTIAGALKG